MKACLKVLKDIQHPFILSPTSVDFDDTGLLIVREFVSAGSLKDAIYGKSPRGTALLKYGQPASIRRLSQSNVKLYGRQILEALNFLSERGFVMGRYCIMYVTRLAGYHGDNLTALGCGRWQAYMYLYKAEDLNTPMMHADPGHCM